MKGGGEGGKKEERRKKEMEEEKKGEGGRQERERKRAKKKRTKKQRRRKTIEESKKRTRTKGNKVTHTSHQTGECKKGNDDDRQRLPFLTRKEERVNRSLPPSFFSCVCVSKLPNTFANCQIW